MNFFLLFLMKNLCQHYIKLHEHEKYQKVVDLLDKLEFNQIIIFVKSTSGCMSLRKFLLDQNFPAVEIHRAMAQEERFVYFFVFQLEQNNK